MSILTVAGICVRYGAVLAVDDVGFSLESGVVTGLIGPNGAGKSTLLDAVSGYVPCSGSVIHDGVDITRLAPHRRALRGVARTFQSAELFSQLSVAQNVQIATERLTLRGLLADALIPRRTVRSARAARALELVGLAEHADVNPSELSHGQRRLVGVARALAMDAQVLLLDEPAAGLDDDESRVFQDHLQAIADSGVAVLLVEHDMRLVFAVCERVMVLVNGVMTAAGPADEVRRDERVIHAYLGQPAPCREPMVPTAPPAVAGDQVEAEVP
jgi:branched-chain amino acid transport system ATP-binding protein